MEYCGAYIPDWVRRSDGPLLSFPADEPKHTPISHEEMQDAADMFREGFTFAEIGRIMGRKRCHLKKRMKEEGYL